jgi:hypothetical protein
VDAGVDTVGDGLYLGEFGHVTSLPGWDGIGGARGDVIRA